MFYNEFIESPFTLNQHVKSALVVRNRHSRLGVWVAFRVRVGEWRTAMAYYSCLFGTTVACRVRAKVMVNPCCEITNCQVATD